MQDGDIRILDPAKARLKREVILGPVAEISNLLQWVDQQRLTRVR